MPCMREDPPLLIRFTGEKEVYPACAGIHLAKRLSYVVIEGLPRMRGDPPLHAHLTTRKRMSTPHARGSTFNKWYADGKKTVYPACAGIHLSKDCIFKWF